MNVANGVLSRCFLFTKSKLNRLFCRYSCSTGKLLVGSKRRYCGSDQKWSGVAPLCIEGKIKLKSL